MSDDSELARLANALAEFDSEVQKRTAQLDKLLAEVNSKLTSITAAATAADSSAKAAAEHQNLANLAAVDAQAKVTEIAATATQATAAKTQITDAQAVIATKSDHIEKAQLHADKVRADLDRTLTAASQQTVEAEGLRARSQSAADSAATLLVEIKASLAAAQGDQTAIATHRHDAEAATAITKDLAATSKTIEERVGNYEKQLSDLKDKCDGQLQTITDLLPGATSAGLAHAFDQRRQSFQKPSLRWQWFFIGSLVALVLLALSGLWNVYRSATPLSYDELLRLWLARLPIAGALVWLALYSGRESALAKRLEEDYGYKSAIASSFLGFHKQMSEIGEKSGENAPLSKLCADTLNTIASPPGRIYDRHKLTVSPASELAAATKAFGEAAGTLKGANK